MDSNMIGDGWQLTPATSLRGVGLPAVFERDGQRVYGSWRAGDCGWIWTAGKRDAGLSRPLLRKANCIVRPLWIAAAKARAARLIDQADREQERMDRDAAEVARIAWVTQWRAERGLPPC